MTTDRELLEDAAKAYYGNDVVVERYDETHNLLVVYDITSGTVFAPLTDDGDALRLAVRLHLTVNCQNESLKLCGNRNVLKSAYADEVDDPYAATRRAIVRAAAAINKEMK